MQPIGQAIQQIMNVKPQLEQSKIDVLSSLDLNNITCLTKPSEKCPVGKCDGDGFLWYVNYHKKTEPKHYFEEKKRLQKAINDLKLEAQEAKVAVDEQHLKQLSDELKEVMAPSEWQVVCECYRQREAEREIARKLDLSGMPEKFRKVKVLGFRTDIYKQEESRTDAELAKRMATNFITDFKTIEPGKGLYLYSETKGAGKTRLACSIGNALMTVHQQTVVYMKAYDLFLQIRKTFSKDSEMTEDEVLKIYRTADVLIIDDIAVENPSDFAERVLYNILDYRMDNFKTTLITSNKTIDELVDLYKLRDKSGRIIEDGDRGERIRSRINKMCYQINMPEESVRDIEAQSEHRAFEQILFK